MKITNFVDNYLKNFKRYRDKWNYEDGCVFIGALNIYKAIGDEKYLSFLLEQLDQLINNQGEILNYQREEFNIDNINSGKVLFDAYEVTRDEKYLLGLQQLRIQLDTHPRNNEGSFWHKQIYPNQVWLDGLYMAMPFYARYEKVFNEKRGYEDIYKQFKTVRNRMWNPDKQLYYHGYDESREERWSNPETGLSQNFWLRAMGWYVMAMVDTLEIIEEDVNYSNDIKDMLKEAVEGLLRYQDSETGMWYQVIDAGNREGNYLETSGTLMISYGILKAVRLGYLPEELKDKAIKAYKGTIDNYMNLEVMELGGICGVAGLGNIPYRDGSYEYYISEKPILNDHKGVGALLMAHSEALRVGL